MSDKPVEVNNRDIENTYYKIVKYIFIEGLKMARRAIIYFMYLLSFVISFLMTLLSLGPIYFTIFGAFILLMIFWDDAVRPLCMYIMIAINGIIGGWNSAKDALGDIGFNVLGKRISFSLSDWMPRSNEISGEIPNFKTFIFKVLFPLLFKPIKKALTGTIFS